MPKDNIIKTDLSKLKKNTVQKIVTYIRDKHPGHTAQTLQLLWMAWLIENKKVDYLYEQYSGSQGWHVRRWVE